MRSDKQIENVARELLSSKGLSLVACVKLQSLWAGYGHICLVTTTVDEKQEDTIQNHKDKRPPTSLILKYINPPAIDSDTTTRPVNEGHVRKILSYQVEQYFYTNLVPLMPKEIGIAECIASIDNSHGQSNATATATATTMLLEDLRLKYPVAGEKRSELNPVQTYGALRWLARFHGFWWSSGRVEQLDRSKLCRPPLEHFSSTNSTTVLEQGGTTIWLNGGYTYLATRRTEYESLMQDDDSEWSSVLCDTIEGSQASVAELAAKFLSPSPSTSNDRTLSSSLFSSSSSHKYLTVIHGDVKSENLFTTSDGESVAFFDFQYVGLGLGVCDLAKLFTCSIPMHMIAGKYSVISSDLIEMSDGEEKMLRFYVHELQEASGKIYEWEIFVRHWETALVDWLRFQASWGFWGNTEWLEGRVRSILRKGEWQGWIQQAQDKSR